ncbi:hypothetical protein R3P38DRAFT_2797882 [Favolaschia claudopus]|uniref:Uncharacterized protein n=1 Tax=Favolaschia claudopus TaxID=2862362 RepID=A0AAW0A2P4_9AGAR
MEGECMVKRELGNVSERKASASIGQTRGGTTEPGSDARLTREAVRTKRGWASKHTARVGGTDVEQNAGCRGRSERVANNVERCARERERTHAGKGGDRTSGERMNRRGVGPTNAARAGDKDKRAAG